MTAKNSGSHLVIEISSGFVSQLLHKYMLSEKGMWLACALWPAPNANFELAVNDDGEAKLVQISPDGSRMDFFSVHP